MQVFKGVNDPVFSVGRLPSWLSLDTPVDGWIKVRKGWHLDGCKREHASGELRPGRWRWMGWRRVVMIRTEMTTDSSRAECRFKKVLAVREKRLLQTAAPAHIVPNQLYFRFTQAKKNKQTKKLKVIYSKSARTYLKHCFSLSVPLWLFHCAVKSHGVQKYSYSAFFLRIVLFRQINTEMDFCKPEY